MQHADGFVRQREPARTYKFVIVYTVPRTTVCVEEPSPGSLSGTSGPSSKFPETEIEPLAEARSWSSFSMFSCLGVPKNVTYSCVSSSRDVNPCPCPEGLLKDIFQVLVLVLVLGGQVLVLVLVLGGQVLVLVLVGQVLVLILVLVV